jgi:hypothetical protein
MSRTVGTALAASVLLITCGVSCGVTSGDGLNPCEDNIPAADGQIARCVLESNQYLQGTFPGSQLFIIRVTEPTQITFSFELSNRISSGTMLTLTSTEPDGSGESSYVSQGDLFQQGGVVSFPITMTEAGDHLIQFSSDAYCSYVLAYQ